MMYFYIGALLTAIGCLNLLDYHYKLAWYADRVATTKTIAVLLAIFIIWDVAGIKNGIFFIGDASVLSGIEVAKDFPLEEFFFLLLLSYQPLLLWAYFDRRSK